jgi:uroporphyrinogen-III synthase
MAVPQPLQGVRILVTRPVHQAVHLCELISAAGGIPLALPVLAIAEPEDLSPARTLVARLGNFAIAIFVSANAVEHGMALIHQQGGLPRHIKLAAVGQRTAEALQRHGAKIAIQAPPPYNSEALLASAALQSVSGQDILIFRGSGGRELLADTLRQRGARIAYAEVYRRVKPDSKLADILAQAGQIDIVVVTSQEGLRNLVEIAGKAERNEWLAQRQLAVISSRVAQLAAELGFKRPALVAAQATDEALLQVIATWRHGAQAAQ